MTRSQFLRGMEEALELGPNCINETDHVKQIEGWDSLSVVVVMAFVDEKVGVLLSPDQIHRAETVGDLMKFCDGKLNG